MAVIEDQGSPPSPTKKIGKKALPRSPTSSSGSLRSKIRKRSIALPRYPFFMHKKLRKSSKSGDSEDSNMKEGIHFEEFKAPVASADASPVDDSSDDLEAVAASEAEAVAEKVRTRVNKLARTKSVRNFFKNVVSQMTVKRSGKRLNGVSEERIAAWKRRFAENQTVPGVVGIRNHGNTCFMNAILQCLSYTDILAEYFVLDQYKSDLKRKKRLQALTALKRRGSSKGEVTEQLATVFKSLWSLQYDPEISIKFKSLVDKHASQYKGGRQHDAQEFLLWLLDQVHEDLNVATRRKPKSKITAEDENPSDEVLAADSLANYMRCNNSFVIDIFQAQFRSSLTCPKCERQSNTFDPFLCVSLPIPQKQLMPVYVTVLYIDQNPRQVKLGLTVGVTDSIGDLRRILSKDTGIPEPQLLLTEIDNLCFTRTFEDTQPITTFKKSDKTLYAIEVPHFKEASEDDGAFIVLTWINVLKEGPIEKRFGSPYTIQVSRETLYTDLQKLLMKEMASILHDDILISQQKVPLFKIRVVDGFDEPSYLDSNVDLPMYTEAIEQAINLCTVSQESSGSPVHVKLVLEWDAPAKSQIIADDKDFVEEHSSVKLVQKSPEEASSVSLQECFGLYTKAETLGQGDAWFCPACNRKQEVVKRMGLWSVPDVLIIHLKRFRQNSSGNGCNKLATLVEFPLENFDMSPNVANRTNGNSQNVINQASQDVYGLKMWSAFPPWRHSTRKNRPQSQPPVDEGGNGDYYTYDLYAVCNHQGTDLQSGHYTATCRNPTDGHWYKFDDVHTERVEEHDVISDSAYILFYQRTASASGSSASSSTNSSNSNREHWVYRMPDFTFKGKNLAKAEEKSKTLPAKDTKNNEPFKRGSGKYATLPVKKSTDVIRLERSDHFSDGEEISSTSESSDDDEDVTVRNYNVNGRIELPVPEKPTNVENDTNLKDVDEDVRRPLDKNDVD